VRFADESVGPPFAKAPGVCRYDGSYWLCYGLRPDGEDGTWTIGIAESDDLEHWENRGELGPEPGHPGVCAPSAAVRSGAIHLFYQTYGECLGA